MNTSQELPTIAYIRKWALDGEKEYKELHERTGRMRLATKFTFLPVTQNKMLEGDVPLVSGPAHAAKVASMQSSIDELMLKYCPQDVTQEQLENWKASQQAARPEEVSSMSKSILRSSP
jgi:hypothetical protein